MKIFYDLPDPPLPNPAALTIGNVDGVHLGHQALLQAMLADATRKGWQAGLLTFAPHPVAVLRPRQTPLYLMTLAERLALLQSLRFPVPSSPSSIPESLPGPLKLPADASSDLLRRSLDFIVVHPFSQATARMSARDFMAILHHAIGLKSLWVGPDFALGRNRSGDVTALRAIGQEMGFDVNVITPQLLDGSEVRSGRIRQHLLDGEVAQAAQKLGRPYQVTGEVVRGAQRGRTLGFPTANLAVNEGRLLPANGVYATWVSLANEGSGSASHPAVTNIGVRPSFGSGRRTVETHLIDYQGDLYGHQLKLQFVERLRPEQHFASINELRDQIAHDVAMARRILNESATAG